MEKNENKSNELAPLLLNGEASSPSCFSETLYSDGDGGHIVVNLETDYDIGYFSKGIAREGNGVGLALYKEWDKVPNPEGKPELNPTRFRVLSCGGAEERLHVFEYRNLPKRFRNENGKLTKKGLKELGNDLALNHIMLSD